MAVVKGDDKVEKILPLLGAAIPIGMAAYGGYKGYKDARVDDPTLGLASGEFGGGWDVGDEDPTQGQRITAGLANALGYGLGGGAFRSATRAGLRGAGRGAATRARYGHTGQVFADDAVRLPRASQWGTGKPTGIGQDVYEASRAGYSTPSFVHGTHQTLGRPLTSAEARHLAQLEATAAGRWTSNPLGRLVGADDAAMAARAAKTGGGTFGRLAQGAGLAGLGYGIHSAAQQLGNLIGGAPNDQQNVNIPNQGAGGSALGEGGMGDMAGQRHGVNQERVVWQKEGGALQQPQPVATGENMRIGEQLLKEAKEDMDKDKSPKGKGKGMILIIGHGGKKSGKDDKKDSPC